MARGRRRLIENSLSKELRDSEFSFLDKNPILINEIYDSVKTQFPDLCDDEYLCSTHCKNGTNQPEWQHVIRGVIDSMSKSGLAQQTGNPKEWIFLPRV